jgi:putative GTP pyrophosphokinase
MALSKTQIDKLGERLRIGDPTEADLRELDDYRRSFSEAYDKALWVSSGLTKQPTGRLKSNTSIVAKLRRESIRLTQIQDIAGCRIVVRDTSDQTLVVIGLTDVNPGAVVVDRRGRPSHGYRAVHVIIGDDRFAEIQVRTALQHRWAEVSEKYSDVVDPSIKYGGGDPDIQQRLLRLSADIAEVENLELEYDASLEMFLDYRGIETLERSKEHINAELDVLMRQLDDSERRSKNR